MKRRTTGRKGCKLFHLAQSPYEHVHCPTCKNYGLYKVTVLVYRAIVEQQTTSIPWLDIKQTKYTAFMAQLYDGVYHAAAVAAPRRAALRGAHTEIGRAHV